MDIKKNFRIGLMLALAAAMMGGCGSKNKGNGQAGTDSEVGNIPVDTALRHRLV